MQKVQFWGEKIYFLLAKTRLFKKHIYGYNHVMISFLVLGEPDLTCYFLLDLDLPSGIAILLSAQWGTHRVGNDPFRTTSILYHRFLAK